LLLNAERGLFVKYNEQKDSFEIIAARNIEKENIEDLSAFSSGVLKRVIETSQPCLFHDVQSDPNISQFESIQIHNIKSILGVPIFRDNKVWGVLLIDSRSNRKEFTEENLVFLDFFSNLVSLALDKIIRFQELQKKIILRNQRRPQKIPHCQWSLCDIVSLIHKVAATVTILYRKLMKLSQMQFIV
jgi:GAF domain-containing protein